MTRRLLLPGILLLLATNAFAGTGRIIILNRDAANVGFNDPTPAAPVGGNEGTTLGQQRLIILQRAADRWSTTLDTNVDIRVRANFATLPCDDAGVVLAQASASSWHANFPGAPRQDVWYPAALANKLAGVDLKSTDDDIATTFNLALDGATCLGDRGWYYGFDGEEDTDTWLFSVALHEIGHGLGMSGYSQPDFVQNRPSVYDLHVYDITAGRRWDQMTSEERRVSRTNTGNLVWSGPNVTAKAPTVLEPLTTLTITEPSPARNYQFGTASFGPPVNRATIAGSVVPAFDAMNDEGPTATDGCTTYVNANDVSGKIALVDRGTCTFAEKALMAQAAGAIGVILADNRASTCSAPPSMGGSEPNVRIPIVSVTQADGKAIRDQVASATVTATLTRDGSLLAGATRPGYVRLYAPCEFEGGSSIYHWDTVASPNLLMEPSVNSDLRDSLDLSLYQMMDIGWTLPARTGRRYVRR
ncbi:MAG TPA: PA domain-containing protein [Thermoanaerobaculia bacterium]|jgi:hypothetical protein